MVGVIGNNGMFDMTNPDIYKALAPIMGLGAAGTYGANQLMDQQPESYKRGGSLPKAQNGEELFPGEGMYYQIPEYTFDYKRRFSDLPKPRYTGPLMSQQLIDEVTQREYEQRRRAINESIAAARGPLSAQRLAKESATTGDKLSLQMMLGDPYNFPRVYEALGGLDFINPAVMLGDMVTGLGSLPYNIQEGNYGSAALGLGAPLATGALASIGVKSPRGFINNLVNPFAGIGDTPRQIPGSPNAVSVVDNVGRVVADTPQPWQMQELPGLHLKSTMENNPQGLHKYIAKDGSIDTKSALEHLKRMEGDAKYEVVLENLQNRYGTNLENMPKRMDYNILRKNIQDDLWDIGTGKGPQVDRYANMDMKSFGIIKNDTPISHLHKPTSLGYENGEVLLDGYSFSNKNKFIGGSDAHNMPKETLGHSRGFTNPKEPGVYYSAERQSNWSQEAGSILKKTDIDLLKKQQKKIPEIIKEQNDLIAAGNDTWAISQKERLQSQLKDVNNKIDSYNRYANASIQEKLIMKNMNERMLQEDVAYAASKGHTKYRLPSEETTAKIQGFKKNLSDEQIGRSNTIEARLRSIEDASLDADGYIDFKLAESKPEHISLKKENKAIWDNPLGNYDNPTILKNAKQSLKDAEKLFGVKLNPITDSNGNTWYEFDIPEKFKQGKGEIKAYQGGGQKIGNYEAFVETLPDNLRNTDSNYNLRGMWESFGSPNSFEDIKDTPYMPLQDDGFYHGTSVNDINGMWLKSTQHPSAWMEYMYGYALNPENNRRFDVVPNVEGYFGDNQLQYVEKSQEYKIGGPLQTDPVLNFITQQQPRRFSKSKK